MLRLFFKQIAAGFRACRFFWLIDFAIGLGDHGAQPLSAVHCLMH